MILKGIFAIQFLWLPFFLGLQAYQGQRNLCDTPKWLLYTIFERQKLKVG
jgi:hypothetical protein